MELVKLLTNSTMNTMLMHNKGFYTRLFCHRNHFLHLSIVNGSAIPWGTRRRFDTPHPRQLIVLPTIIYKSLSTKLI